MRTISDDTLIIKIFKGFKKNTSIRGSSIVYVISYLNYIYQNILDNSDISL